MAASAGSRRRASRILFPGGEPGRTSINRPDIRRLAIPWLAAPAIAEGQPVPAQGARSRRFHQGRVEGLTLRHKVAESIALADPVGQRLQQRVVFTDFPFGMIGMHLGQCRDVLLQVVEQRYPLQYQVERDQPGHDDREGGAKDDDLARRSRLFRYAGIIGYGHDLT